MATTIQSDVIMEQLPNLIRNPRAAVRLSLDLVEQLTEGETIIVDPSNPFAYSLEMAATMTSYGLIQAEALGRRLYPSMAKTQEDAYLHMADKDYLDRFATPSETMIGFIAPLQEIYGKAVPIQDGTGARALVIPRHTSITVSDLTFTIQYPIVIKVLFNNTLSISLDLTNKTPTYLPVTNALRWTKSQLENNDWLVIDVPVQQVKIISQVIQLVSFSGYSKTYSFDDNFYYARAYIPVVGGGWKEISVTHQKQVYNPNTPTVCLQVFNSSVQMYIPQIYFQNGTITGTVRLDIYTTKGKIDEDLANVDVGSFKVKFQDLDSGLTQYSTPFEKFTNISAITRAPVTGGANPITFTELLSRLTQRSQFTEGLPISTSQLGSALRREGFDTITTLDNITRKQYTATRQVDPPKDKTTVTGLGCSIQLIDFTINDLDVDPIVYTSTKRAMLKPTTLFIHDKSGIRVLSNDQRDALLSVAAASPDGIANIVNDTQYYYTPFHYVFDMTQSTFGVRPYYMTSPAILSRYIYQQNDDLGLNIRSDKYGIEYIRTGTGYKIGLTLESNASINSFTADKVSLQLSYLVPDSSKRGWLTGTLVTPIDPSDGKPVDNRWEYVFDIPTEFDINNLHQMDITSTGFPVGLVQEFDLIVVLKDYLPNDATFGDIDTIISMENITNYDPMSTYIGATQEKISVRFGDYLERLWKRSRTIVDAPEYRRYEEDVPEHWVRDFYEPGPNGLVKFTYDYDTQSLVTNKLHSAGDPVIGPDGEPVIRHRKGDIMLDENGDPIPIKNEVELARQVDIFLVDGRYYFATNDSTLEYVDSSLDTISGWIINTISTLAKRCIEMVNLYYYPKSSNGKIDVIVGDGTMSRIDAAQALRVVYTLRKEKYKNAEIRENLTKITPSLLMQAFETLQRQGSGVLTKNDIISLLKNLLKDDIIDVEITGFLNDEYKAVLLSDVSSVPTIGKRLVTLSNLTLQVQDDVDVEFNVLDKDVIKPYTIKR